MEYSTRNICATFASFIIHHFGLIATFKSPHLKAGMEVIRNLKVQITTAASKIYLTQKKSIISRYTTPSCDYRNTHNVVCKSQVAALLISVCLSLVVQLYTFTHKDIKVSKSHKSSLSSFLSLSKSFKIFTVFDI